MTSAHVLALALLLPSGWATAAEPSQTGDSSAIGKRNLDEARALLDRAHNDLAPSQWELLDRKLTEAERAFDRFNNVVSASGKVALVGRGMEQLSRAGRAAEATEGLDAAAQAGPLLGVLILLWPSETAGPEHDHGPDWLSPEEDFKAKLRELSKAAQQVRSDLTGARRAPSETGREREPEQAARRSKDTSKPGPTEAPKVYKRAGDYCKEWTVPENWIYPPGKRPCDVIGSGGPGLSKGGRKDWVHCRYLCGDVQKELQFWGNSIEACLDPKNRPVY